MAVSSRATQRLAKTLRDGLDKRNAVPEFRKATVTASAGAVISIQFADDSNVIPNVSCVRFKRAGTLCDLPQVGDLVWVACFVGGGTPLCMGLAT